MYSTAKLKIENCYHTMIFVFDQKLRIYFLLNSAAGVLFSSCLTPALYYNMLVKKKKKKKKKVDDAGDPSFFFAVLQTVGS